MRQPPPPTSGKGSCESASVTSTEVCLTEALKDSLNLAAGCQIEGYNRILGLCRYDRLSGQLGSDSGGVFGHWAPRESGGTGDSGSIKPRATCTCLTSLPLFQRHADSRALPQEKGRFQVGILCDGFHVSRIGHPPAKVSTQIHSRWIALRMVPGAYLV
jgi:hypothetical protein